MRTLAKDGKDTFVMGVCCEEGVKGLQRAMSMVSTSRGYQEGVKGMTRVSSGCQHTALELEPVADSPPLPTELPADIQQP